MRRLVRWWRALLALGSETKVHRIGETIVIRGLDGNPVEVDRDEYSAERRRAFFKLVDKGLDELSHDRRRKSEAS